ncbi:unnamed protein product [Mytilus coruscus]|uniref:SH3 domain-containing protein n=1 Tax=Mytilus coruscus TaxID=42192 RepID=A0A6J8EUP2_MYTCO|nr:unnamed protein product [Mytilus coruscus]
MAKKSEYYEQLVELPILKENENLWIIKLVHTDEAKSKFFRVSSEPDLNMWTERFNDGIVFANNAHFSQQTRNRQSYAQWPNNSESGIYNYGGRHYQDGHHAYEALSTHNEQEPIHQSYSEMSIGQSNGDLYEEVNRTTEHAEVNRPTEVYRPTEVNRPTNCPPKLPPRPKKEDRMANSYLDLDKVVDDANKSTNETNINENQANQPESSSEYEEDYENDSCGSDASYENTSDNQNGYFNVRGGTSSFHNKHEESTEDDEPDLQRNCRKKTKRRTLEKIELSPGSAYSVISTKPYIAQTSDELSFAKDVKFVVVGRETKRWHIGKIGRKKGFFPAECVKIIQLSDNDTTTQDFPYSVIALKPYTGNSFDEISFRKEDKFNVVGKETERWLVGEINGKRGLFPRDNVKKCQLVLQKSLAKSKRHRSKDMTRQSTFTVIATKSYIAKKTTEISFSKEDKFTAVGQKSSEWLMGEIGGKKGLFPSKCVKECIPLYKQQTTHEVDIYIQRLLTQAHTVDVMDNAYFVIMENEF